MHKHSILKLFVFLGILLCCQVSLANDLQVTPIRLDLSAQHVTEALTLTNQGDQPSVIETQAYTWTKTNRGDVYTPTRDLLISPPIFTLQPHSTQVIRVALRRPPDATKTLAYRIYLQEVAPAVNQKKSGIQIALRLGIPVYIDAADKTTKTS